MYSKIYKICNDPPRNLSDYYKDTYYQFPTQLDNTKYITSNTERYMKDKYPMTEGQDNPSLHSFWNPPTAIPNYQNCNAYPPISKFCSNLNGYLSKQKLENPISNPFPDVNMRNKYECDQNCSGEFPLQSTEFYRLFEENEEKSHSDDSCSQGQMCSNMKDPALFGKHLWSYMHFMSSNYPNQPSKQQQQEMMTWLKCLSSTIPCPECSVHYRQYIDNEWHNLSDICSCKSKLFKFLVDLHNKVNKRLKKPEMNLNEAKKMYYYQRA
jgi:hypothetical protein